MCVGSHACACLCVLVAVLRPYVGQRVGGANIYIYSEVSYLFLVALQALVDQLTEIASQRNGVGG